eukprot:6225060-Pyramimonas_sp.AAC.1
MLVKDLRLIGETYRATFARSSDANRSVVSAFDMSKKVPVHFETPADAGTLFDNFSARNKTRDYPDPLNPSVNLSLRYRRDMNLNSRQLFLSLGKLRNRISYVVRDKRTGSRFVGLWRQCPCASRSARPDAVQARWCKLCG